LGHPQHIVDIARAKRSAAPRRRSHRRGAHRDGRAALRLPEFEAVIAGGGPAGLSAALVLGRARRRVLTVDTDRPANAASSAVGGLLAQSGVAPVDLRRAGREQLADHPTVELRLAEVLDAERVARGFAVTLGDGTAVRTRTLILAHGLRYDPPALRGVEALWGRSVFHCPFCDGWEMRDRPLAVHGSGPEAARSAMVVAGWSSDVVFVRTQRGQPNGLAAALGCRLTAGGTIVTDDDGRTGVPGVYAAGDAATEHSRSVANAIGTGSRVAYAVALDLVPEMANVAA
jgi:thioredoxin reductase